MSAPSMGQDLIRSIQSQIDGLKKTPDGEFLFRLIDRGLRRRGGHYTGDMAHDFIEFLHGLLSRYASNPSGDTVTRIKVRLLQQRLAPHLLDELETEVDADTPEINNATVEERTNKPETGGAYEDATPDEPASRPPPVSSASKKEIDLNEFDLDDIEIDESIIEQKLQERIANEDVDKAPSVSIHGKNENNIPRTEEERGVGRKETSRERPLPEDFKTQPEEISRKKPEPELPSDEKGTKRVYPGEEQEAFKSRFKSRSLDTGHLSLEGESEGQEPDALEESETPTIPLDTVKDIEDDIRKPVIQEKRKRSIQGKPKKAKTDMITPEKVSIIPVERRANEQTSRARVDRLHDNFAGRLVDIISRNKEYNTLLRANLKSLKLADSPDSVLDIKHVLVRGLEELVRGNKALGKELGATNHYLKISELDRNLLKDELDRAQDQSMVDDLTGLHNRIAFIQLLKGEIGRSKRYGFSLALAVVMLDQFEDFRKTHGKEAADAVLRTFGQEVLSGFRGYDAVARLHDRQFGILFPNTQKEGALSALEKTQKRASKIVIQLNGKSLRLPTFTSALTLYKPGDKPEVLMKRAYDALSLASESSREKIIVALAQT